MSEVNVVFTAEAADALGQKALGILAKAGYLTGEAGKVAKTAIEVMLFSYDPPASALYHWPSRHMRRACHITKAQAPSWVETPFTVALRVHSSPTHANTFGRSLELMATDFVAWLEARLDGPNPFHPMSGQNPVLPTDAEHVVWLENWYKEVATYLKRRDLSLRELKKARSHSYDNGRGGAVVYRDLTEFIFRGQKLPSNEVFQAYMGGKGVVSLYMTSDLTNVFELMAVIKAAYTNGHPGVFLTYSGSHNNDYWIDGFLSPGMQLLGLDTNPLNSLKGYKYTSKCDVGDVLQKAGLNLPLGKFVSFSGLYGRVHMDLLYQLSRWLPDFPTIFILDFETILYELGYWDMPMNDFAALLVPKMQGDPVFLHQSDGSNARLSECMSNSKTLQHVHARGGWLGGAAIYYSLFSLSEHGGLNMLIKDSTHGLVNRLALNFDSECLAVQPFNLFRLTAEGQNVDWSIDPLVLLNLFEVWGDAKSRAEMMKVWDAIKVPMPRSEIGRKTVARVKHSGIEISSFR